MNDEEKADEIEGRRYPRRPIVGVGVVVVRGDRVLLIRRGKPPRQGQWSLPGGAQELGETVEEAGRREVLEETGLHLERVAPLTVVDLIDRDEAGEVRFHYTLVDLVASSVTGEPQAAGDAADAVWVSFDDAARLPLWNETHRILGMARTRLHEGLFDE
ncbi:MAG: NUDIX hydrolase [Geminicoccaceae bacterium]|nr:NUDIX hydrolase [Geminicoccaceae bacterium]